MITNNKLTKPLEVLIVEDEQHHIDDAKKTFGPLARAGLVNFHYVTNLFDAKFIVNAKVTGGVISDVFLPTNYSSHNFTDRPEKSYLNSVYSSLRFKAIDKYERKEYLDEDFVSGDSISPSGFILTKYCWDEQDNSTPIVMCNDDDYHGLNPRLVRHMGDHIEGFVNSSSDINYDYNMDYSEDSGKKNWKKAFDLLVPSLIAERKLDLIWDSNTDKFRENFAMISLSNDLCRNKSLDYCFNQISQGDYMPKHQKYLFNNIKPLLKQLLFRK